MLEAKFHEIVLQILFALEFQGDEDVMSLVMKEAKVAKRHVKEAYGVASEIFAAASDFDQQIKAASKEYELERIGSVEKNILRYALHEIKQGVDVPLVVTESVRLARKFSTPEAGSFIHGVLQTLTTLPPQSEGASS